jgi:hypothetical protein
LLKILQNPARICYMVLGRTIEIWPPRSAGVFAMPKYETILNNSDEFTDVKLTPAEGIAAIAVIAMLADSPSATLSEGPDAEISAEDLIDILQDFEIFDEYKEAELFGIIDKLMEIVDGEGLGALFNAADDVEVISDDLVIDAYAMAVATLIDEDSLEIPPSKQAFMKELREALDVDEEEAASVLEDVVNTLKAVDVEETKV